MLLVDDHPSFLTMLEALLAAEAQLEIVGRAHDGAEAVEAVGKLKPDVVVMDVSMPRMDGIEATRLIRDDHPETRVLILSGSQAARDLEAARAAGAAGFVAKEFVDRLPEAILAAT